MTKILVAYASKHHSTAEIAEAIGQVLRYSGGLEVDVCSVETVETLSPYDAVVLGSAVYVGQWQAAAVDFLMKHEAEMVQRPVWFFSSGPTGEGDPKALMKGWNFPEKLQPIADHIKPRDIRLFHGSLDPAQLNLFERVITKGVKSPVGDFRDWNMILAWAADIAQALENEPPEVSPYEEHEAKTASSD